MQFITSAATAATCVHCFTRFDAADIRRLEWLDDGEALCSNCGVDAVAPGHLTRDQMLAAHAELFVVTD